MEDSRVVDSGLPLCPRCKKSRLAAVSRTQDIEGERETVILVCGSCNYQEIQTSPAPGIPLDPLDPQMLSLGGTKERPGAIKGEAAARLEDLGEQFRG